MGGGEDLRVLDPQAGEAGDGEEPAVRQLGVAAPPRDQLVVLPVVHLPRAAVARAVGDREAVLVVAQLAVDDREVVEGVGRVGEHRQQQPPPLPVDVEPGGVRRRAAAAQHVPPGGVGGRHGHPRVVRHDVHDEAQPHGAQGPQQPLPARLAAEFRVDGPVVDDVVAVRRAGGGGEQRRAVEVRHAEVGEVAGEPGGGVEVEVGADLHPVGGAHPRHVRSRGGGHVSRPSSAPRGSGPARTAPRPPRPPSSSRRRVRRC